jgi:hypothetical protein
MYVWCLSVGVRARVVVGFVVVVDVVDFFERGGKIKQIH